MKAEQALAEAEIVRRHYGKRNRYTCKKCRAETVTIDVDRGVAPFMIRCPACREESASSSFYRVEGKPEPSHEFYRPTLKELMDELPTGVPAHWDYPPGDHASILAGLREGVLNHVSQGGLLLRKIPEIVLLRVFRAKGRPAESLGFVASDCEVECKKCGEICCIDDDGMRSVAWCATCEAYAEGFDGADWWSEKQAGIADGLNDERTSGADS